MATIQKLRFDCLELIRSRQFKAAYEISRGLADAAMSAGVTRDIFYICDSIRQLEASANPESYENAYLAPIGPRSSDGSIFGGGIWVENQQLLELSMLRRSWGYRQSPRSTLVINKKGRPHHVVYGGILFGHYGHFLLESLSRYYAYCNTSELVVFQSLDFRGLELLPSYISEILTLLDFDLNRLVIENAGGLFDKVTLPAPGYITSPYFSSIQAQCLERASVSVRRLPKLLSKYSGKKVYLSRLRINEIRSKDTAIGDESRFQEKLKENGYEVIYPEEVSVSEQIAIFLSATVIVGVIGSAFHTMILCDAIQADIYIIERNTFTNPNYATVNAKFSSSSLKVTFIKELRKDGFPDFLSVYRRLAEYAIVNDVA